MGTLLVRNAEVLVTMDDRRREIPRGGFFARDGWIEAVGPSNELPTDADEVVDVSGHVVLPGLVNTHHHLYQTLTRAFPGARNVRLFDWLGILYPVWGRLTPDDIAVSTILGMAELALSGCTATADHLYLFPNGSALDDAIEAARQTGLRFHAARGSMSLGRSAGGLPPDDLVEDETAILEDTARLVEQYHDPRPGASLRIVVAPCSPFSVTPEAMVEAARLARSHGVRLHTHLAETVDEERYCVERFGARPVEYAERLGWLGDDVWFAHGVHLDGDDIATLASSRTGVAHCPTSNMRLGSGIAPLRRMLERGVPVGLGVDGSASNDSGHLLAEARQAMLAARVAASDDPEAPLLTGRAALELATRGGAAVLGRDDVGMLAPGMAADAIAVDLDRVGFSGAGDPVAALVLCAPTTVDRSWVGGRSVVVGGRMTTVDVPRVVAAHRKAARRLVEG